MDNAASGLIVAAVGKCTRLLPFIEAQEKVYEFTLHLGNLTDTLEPSGKVIATDENCHRSIKQLNDALYFFLGEIEQIPPAFSAVKINGKRASDIAVKGGEVELKARRIVIEELRIIEGVAAHNVAARGILTPTNKFYLYCKCSKGTYIRSLARDIAKKLGTYGTASDIRRIAIGNISLEDAVLPENLTEENLIPPEKMLNWKVVKIDEEQEKKILNGSAVFAGCDTNYDSKSGEMASGNLIFVENANGKIIGVSETQNGYLIPQFLL